MWSSSYADVKDVNIWLPQAAWHSVAAGSSGPVPRTRRLPTSSASRGGALWGGERAWGECPPHHGISIKARKPAFSLSWTNASPSRRLKESPFPFAPLCTLPLRIGLPLSSRVGGSLRRWTVALSGQKACVPISEDGLAPTASGAFYVPAECRQSAHFFKNELPSSGWVLATGT